MSTTATQWKELARRTGNGVEAALLWDESVSRVKVMVSDGRLCHQLEFEVGGPDELGSFARPFSEVVSQLLPAARTDDFWGFKQSVGQTTRED